jgi:inorganic pyrophosphatase/exopolyphosphatase
LEIDLETEQGDVSFFDPLPVADRNEESKDFASEDQVKNEQNKYNRNFILVLDTVKSYEHLFSSYEKELMRTYVHDLSNNAQIILARLMLRKRIWFN